MFLQANLSPALCLTAMQLLRWWVELGPQFAPDCPTFFFNSCGRPFPSCRSLSVYLKAGRDVGWEREKESVCVHARVRIFKEAQLLQHCLRAPVRRVASPITA